MTLEYRAVSILSSLAPWLAPLPSAFLIFRGSVEYLDFPSEIAILTAAGVEALGIAAINTALMLANYNRDKGKAQPSANPGAAPGTAYLTRLNPPCGGYRKRGNTPRF